MSTMNVVIIEKIKRWLHGLHWASGLHLCFALRNCHWRRLSLCKVIFKTTKLFQGDHIWRQNADPKFKRKCHNKFSTVEVEETMMCASLTRPPRCFISIIIIMIITMIDIIIVITMIIIIMIIIIIICSQPIQDAAVMTMGFETLPHNDAAALMNHLATKGDKFVTNCHTLLHIVTH